MDSSENRNEDGAILQNADRTLSRLGVSAYKPTRVLWLDYIIQTGTNAQARPIGNIRAVPVGWPVFTWDTLLLPSDMRGKLRPEEWTPLLMSSIVYDRILRGIRINGVAKRLGTPLGLALLGWGYLFFGRVPQQLLGPLLGLDFLSLVAVALLGLLLVNPFFRSARLRADTLSASIGSDALGPTLLEVLEKMNHLGLKDSFAGGRTSNRPTLAQRITNLRSTA